MSKKSKKNSSTKQHPGYDYIQTVAGVEEHVLKKNKLRVLFLRRPNTGIVTTNITYLAGAKDEERGETGAAHMLEHMLFKPTAFDKKRKSTESAAMLFEKETGCYINANTWKDRTTYIFTVPSESLNKAVQIEAERMTGTILTEKELHPERNNVLSEFDMYNGDPTFALSTQMIGVALQSHPYGHETIGYREDIEDYTAEKLERFYRNYYRPDNAIMMIVGDVDRATALNTVKEKFSHITNPDTPIPRFSIREPKQEGVRRVSITRPGNTSMLCIGFLQAGFPSREWFATQVLNDILVGDDESILQKKFVDTGIVSSMHNLMEPTCEKNLGMLIMNLPQNSDASEIEKEVLKAIQNVTKKDVQALLKKTKTKLITEELFHRDHSRKIAQELTEYVSSDDWEQYGKTESILESLTAAEVHALIAKLYNIDQLTIGTYSNK